MHNHPHCSHNKRCIMSGILQSHVLYTLSWFIHLIFLRDLISSEDASLNHHKYYVLAQLHLKSDGSKQKNILSFTRSVPQLCREKSGYARRRGFSFLLLFIWLHTEKMMFRLRTKFWLSKQCGKLWKMALLAASFFAFSSRRWSQARQDVV